MGSGTGVVLKGCGFTQDCGSGTGIVRKGCGFTPQDRGL
jgi:hypothetical protein